jgi:hypothetical protein
MPNAHQPAAKKNNSSNEQRARLSSSRVLKRYSSTYYGLQSYVIIQSCILYKALNHTVRHSCWRQVERTHTYVRMHHSKTRVDLPHADTCSQRSHASVATYLRHASTSSAAQAGSANNRRLHCTALASQMRSVFNMHVERVADTTCCTHHHISRHRHMRHMELNNC